MPPHQVVEITPPALKNIGYKTYIIFAVFNLVCAVIVWLFYPETMGLTLESIDLLFIKDDDEEDEDGHVADSSKRFYQRLQWWVVPKAWEAVKKSKAERAAAASGNKDGVVEAGAAGSSVLGPVENGKGVDEVQAEVVG
jgi:hypothetical protein